MKIITQYNENKLQGIIAKTSKIDALKIEAYKNKSTYVNPCKIRNGG
jgi:hypothetical protein